MIAVPRPLERPAGEGAKFKNIKIGYDTERDQYGSVKADDDIDAECDR